MPSVEFFQNNQTGEIIKCSYMHCKELGGGSTPTGPLQRVPFDEFKHHAAEIIQREFDQFFVRDYEIRSELYDEMSESQQDKFFREHAAVTVSLSSRSKLVSIFAGHDLELFLKLTYPFEDDMIATHLLHAFNASRSRD